MNSDGMIRSSGGHGTYHNMRRSRRKYFGTPAATQEALLIMAHSKPSSTEALGVWIGIRFVLLSNRM